MAVTGGLIHHYGTYRPERAATGDWGSVVFPLIVATPAVLALLGLQHRPWLLATAGLLLLPMCFLSFSFLFFPLLIPAILFLTDAITRPRNEPRRRLAVRRSVRQRRIRDRRGLEPLGTPRSPGVAHRVPVRQRQ